MGDFLLKKINKKDAPTTKEDAKKMPNPTGRTKNSNKNKDEITANLNIMAL